MISKKKSLYKFIDVYGKSQIRELLNKIDMQKIISTYIINYLLKMLIIIVKFFQYFFIYESFLTIFSKPVFTRT